MLGWVGGLLKCVHSLVGFLVKVFVLIYPLFIMKSPVPIFLPAVPFVISPCFGAQEMVTLAVLAWGG